MRYFFDLVDARGTKTVDSHGIAFTDFEQARLEARRILTRVAAERLEDNLTLRLSMRDQNNAEVYDLALAITGRRMGPQAGKA
jgi:hypothetical protein